MILRINYIHPLLTRRLYAECSPLFQLIKLINDIRVDAYDTILQQIALRMNSYRTFSYNVSMVWVNAMIQCVQLVLKQLYLSIGSLLMMNNYIQTSTLI